MNERIKELARQAGLIAPYGSDREGLSDFDYREFAELIVQEAVHELFLHGYDDAAQRLTKYFSG
jgi:hypothetical protein